jgi:hypothetical protein
MDFEKLKQGGGRRRGGPFPVNRGVQSPTGGVAMALARINGIELYYEVHGEGPALIFAHGAGGNHLSWWQQVPALAQSYRCVTFDHRGFGLSREQPGGPGARAFVDDLRALLEHLGIERGIGRAIDGRMDSARLRDQISRADAGACAL